MNHRYLGARPSETVAQVRALAPEEFALAEEVAERASQLLVGLQVPKDDRLLAMALLFRRIVAAYEAILALAERGMLTEGTAIHRSQIEALFVLGALWQQPELLEVYLANDVHRRRDLYAKIKKLSKTLRNTLSPELAPDIVDAEHSRLVAAARGVTYMGVEQWAQSAKLHDLYLTKYAFLSEGVHHTAKDVERHIGLSPDGEVDSLHWGPEKESPSGLLIPTMGNTLMAEECIFGAFQLKDREAWAALRSRLEELSSKHVS